MGQAVIGAVALVLVVPALPATAAPADAAASSDGLHVIYRAAAGQVNHPRVTRAPEPDQDPDTEFRRWLVTVDDIAPIRAGTACSRPGDDVTVVVCRYSEHYEDPSGVEVYLGDRDDRWDGGPAAVDGGAGNDALSGGGHLIGGPGDDTITGNDRVQGYRARDDTLVGGAGNDVIRAGRGRDGLSGGPGNDRLYGNSGDDVIHGNSGNDTISGGPGADRISGGPGRDTVRPD